MLIETLLGILVIMGLIVWIVYLSMCYCLPTILKELNEREYRQIEKELNKKK